MTIKNKFIALTISFAISLSSAAYGQEKHQEHQTKPDTSVGTGINDSVITTKVKSALLNRPLKNYLRCRYGVKNRLKMLIYYA